jgi:hypothetical protein
VETLEEKIKKEVSLLQRGNLVLREDLDQELEQESAATLQKITDDLNEVRGSLATAKDKRGFENIEHQKVVEELKLKLQQQQQQEEGRAAATAEAGASKEPVRNKELVVDSLCVCV